MEMIWESWFIFLFLLQFKKYIFKCYIYIPKFNPFPKVLRSQDVSSVSPKYFLYAAAEKYESCIFRVFF